jgi:hypothetical protein
MALIKRHELSDTQGQALFEAAMQGIGTWRVTAITQAAVEALIASDFDMRLVCRAHSMSRRETFVSLRVKGPPVLLSCGRLNFPTRLRCVVVVVGPN